MFWKKSKKKMILCLPKKRFCVSKIRFSGNKDSVGIHNPCGKPLIHPALPLLPLPAACLKISSYP